MVVATNGAVVKVTTETNANTFTFTILLGTDTQIQDGMQYPNVFRVLQDVGGTDSRDEWWWFDNSNPFPWQGAVFGPELLINSWSDASSAGGEISVIGTALHLINTTGTARGRTTIATTIGKTYNLTVDVQDSSIFLNVGTSAGSGSIVNTNLSVGNIELQFIATTTTTHIQLSNGTLGITSIADGTSVKEIL